MFMNKKLFYEILRFLLVGGIATIFDFGGFELGTYVLFKNMSEVLNQVLSTALGFIIGNIINYILSIIFVFKGAKEDKKTQTVGAFLIFTIIGVIGLFIKIGCQTGGEALMGLMFTPETDFWAWFMKTFVYCVATVIVLVWNYVGRKLLIFKNSTKNEVKNESEGE